MEEELVDTNYYIFVTSNLPSFDAVIPATKVITDLLNSGYWVVGSRSHNRSRIKEGDRAIFYAAGRGNSRFTATATIASKCMPITAQQKLAIDEENAKLLEELNLDFPNLQSFKINAATFFERPVCAKEIRERISFIKNSDRWGAYFQGGCRMISKNDFTMILNEGLTLKSH